MNNNEYFEMDKIEVRTEKTSTYFNNIKEAFIMAKTIFLIGVEVEIYRVHFTIVDNGRKIVEHRNKEQVLCTMQDLVQSLDKGGNYDQD